MRLPPVSLNVRHLHSARVQVAEREGRESECRGEGRQEGLK